MMSAPCRVDRVSCIWHYCRICFFVVYTQQYLHPEDRFCEFDAAACDILSDSGIGLLCSLLQHNLFAHVTFCDFDVLRQRFLFVGWLVGFSFFRFDQKMTVSALEASWPRQTIICSPARGQ